LIKEPEDIEKFRYLLRKPSYEHIKTFHERARNVKTTADKEGLLINGVGGFGKASM